MNINTFEVLLDDGIAQLMGDDLVVVDQVDPSAPLGSTRRHNRVVLSRSALETLLAALA